MATLGLGFVDWLIIVVYFAFIIGLGIYLKRFTKTQFGAGFQPLYLLLLHIRASP